MDFRSYPIERPEDLQRAFAAMTRDGIGFLLLDATHPYPTDWPRVAELALRHKLPAISEAREFVAAGGLMSYGVKPLRHDAAHGPLRRQDSQRRQGRRPSSRTADQVRAGHQPQDREGTRPRRAAALLVRADEVIE